MQNSFLLTHLVITGVMRIMLQPTRNVPKLQNLSEKTTSTKTQSYVKPFLLGICRRQFLSATLHSFVATSNKDLGSLTKLDVRHDGIPFITQWKLDWAVVKPAWGGDR